MILWEKVTYVPYFYVYLCVSIRHISTCFKKAGIRLIVIVFYVSMSNEFTIDENCLRVLGFLHGTDATKASVFAR